MCFLLTSRLKNENRNLRDNYDRPRNKGGYLGQDSVNILLPTLGPCHECKDDSFQVSSEGGTVLKYPLGNLQLLALKGERVGYNSQTHTIQTHLNSHNLH